MITLDHKKLLGFKLAANTGAKIGVKPLVAKVGAKIGVKISSPRIGAKVGGKTMSPGRDA